MRLKKNARRVTQKHILEPCQIPASTSRGKDVAIQPLASKDLNSELYKSVSPVNYGWVLMVSG